MSMQELLEQLKSNAGNEYGFLMRHFVCLGGSYKALDGNGNEISEAQPFLYSGWIIVIDTVWWFVTAGHILNDLDEKLERTEIKLTGCVLIDRFGPDAAPEQNIPFVYESTARIHIWDEDLGLDFAVIALSGYYKRFLETNNIQPATEEAWGRLDLPEFDFYIMLGLPVELRAYGTPGRTSGIYVEAYPTLIVIDRLDAAPEGTRETEFPRFIGKLPEDLVLEKLDGMSGGPIFGFNTEQSRYTIVAVQSAWLKERKITYGCPVAVFARIVQEYIRAIVSSDAG